MSLVWAFAGFSRLLGFVMDGGASQSVWVGGSYETASGIPVV